MIDASEHAANGGMIALALGLVKLLEHLITWITKKAKGEEREKTVVVELGPEPSRMLREVYEATQDIRQVTELKDNDGVPLVFTPRSMIQTQMAAALRDVDRKTDEIAESVEQISRDIKKGA